MTCSLYRHFDKNGFLLYVGISLHFLKRQIAHNKKSKWFRSVVRIEIEQFPDAMLAAEAEEIAIKTEKPLHNITHSNDKPLRVFTKEDRERRRSSRKRMDDLRVSCMKQIYRESSVRP